VTIHGKLPFQVSFNFDRPRLKPNWFRRYAIPLRPLIPTRSRASPSVRSVARCVFLLFEANGTRTSRLRNFDTEPRYPYCYGFESDNRLESVANAHTAADLHVRPESQTALVSRAVGAANLVRDTSSLVSRNENDSRRAPTKTTWRSPIRPANFRQSRKVLNLCADSKYRAAVIFRTNA